VFLPVSASIRQFARAVTADRLVGDELAIAVAAEANQKNVNGAPPANRVEWFRRFIIRWREVIAEDAAPKPFSNSAFIKSMGPLPSEARLVLLLSDVCGFSAREVEEILQPLSRPYEDLLSEGRAIVRSARGEKSALIVEDEPLIAADLKDVLEDMGVTVVGMARTAEQGARQALENSPDIVLADYNLDGQKTGVDAVAAFHDAHQCPVIFITGYPDEVLKGDEVEPDFVIVKPYRPEAVQAAVAHCLDAARYAAIDADATTAGDI